MSCNEFQANLDRYIDGELIPTDMRSAAQHASACSSCETLVTSSQQLSALLTTAVTDRVTAVDVSGLWKSIEAKLDQDDFVTAESGAPRHVSLFTNPSPWRRFGGWVGALVGTTTEGSFMPVRLGALAAAAAAVALMVVFPATETETPRVGPATTASTKSIGPAASSIIMAAAAKSRVRPVRIDSMEVAAGRNVTTWMRPKTKTRVIWVGDSNATEGFGVDNLSLER